MRSIGMRCEPQPSSGDANEDQLYRAWNDGPRHDGKLQKAGYELVVHDLTRQAASQHLANGATWAETPRAVAEACGVVFTSLPTPADVETVGVGGNGLTTGFRKGAAWFDLSTNAVDVARRLHARLAEQGVDFLDAPVSGGPAGASSGKLSDPGRWRQGRLRPLQAGAGQHGRSGALHWPHRRRIDC